MAKHLASLGLTVKQVGDTVPVSATRGSDLIVISSTANAHILGDKFADSKVPIFTWDTFDYPNLGMTGPVLHKDFGVINPRQDYADSFMILYGYLANITSDISRSLHVLHPHMFGTLYLEPGTAGWGRPGPGGTVITDFDGNPHEAGVFTYERGASLADGQVARAKRVGFYLANGNFHLLTAVYGPAAKDPHLRKWAIGLKLFDTALRWALSPSAPIPRYDPAALRARLRQAAAGKKILFVERVHGGEGRKADAQMVSYLRGLGFGVDIADQMDPQTRAHGKNLVIISSTCSKYKLAGKYADAPVPVLALEGLDADALHLVGRHRYVDYGEYGEERESDDPPDDFLDIVGSWSPMAAGLPAGLVQFAQHPSVVKWASPGPNAIVIATLPNAPSQSAIFGYPKGAPMVDGFIAPARRALMGLDNPTFSYLTPQGKALFDAIVLWSISGS
ncbi:MAG: hypothetical protein EPN38_07960 [Rhodanobacteraceae bacterium]|nr:MAG: hypothetical protein EPN38_07960 [Rhodanobacteraceae bacterium]